MTEEKICHPHSVIFIRGPFNKFPDFFCTGIYNCHRLLKIHYVIAIHLMRWLTKFYDFRFKWTPTAAIGIHPTKAWLSQCNLTWGHFRIKFCFKLGKNAATETYGMLQTAFRPSCMNRWDLPEVVGTVQQVHCSRRRLLRRGLEFHVCTINKSAHTKKYVNLFNDPRIYIYIYIYIHTFICTLTHKHYGEIVGFCGPDKMIKLSGKVNESNTYNGFSGNISFFMHKRTSSY